MRTRGDTKDPGGREPPRIPSLSPILKQRAYPNPRKNPESPRWPGVSPDTVPVPCLKHQAYQTPGRTCHPPSGAFIRLVSHFIILRRWPYLYPICNIYSQNQSTSQPRRHWPGPALSPVSYTHLDVYKRQIATKVGFLDGRYFSQLFRKLTLRTPSEYRNQQPGIHSIRAIPTEK